MNALAEIYHSPGMQLIEPRPALVAKNPNVTIVAQGEKRASTSSLSPRVENGGRGEMHSAAVSAGCHYDLPATEAALPI